MKNEECGVVFHEFTENEPIHIDKEFCLKYKHLFKVLEWFEDRPENELPKFVNYGWEGRERVPVTIKDFNQGFTWLNSDRQYLCHAVPVWD